MSEEEKRLLIYSDLSDPGQTSNTLPAEVKETVSEAVPEVIIEWELP